MAETEKRLTAGQRLAAFIDIAEFEYHAHDNWRKGQSYFNALHFEYPNLAERVRGSKIDPFNRDDVIPSLIAWLYIQFNRGEAS